MATLFTKIIRGEIKGNLVYEDDLCAALEDVNPQAPKHILIVPKKEIESPGHADAADATLLGHLFLTAAKVAEKLGLKQNGYRLVINVGEHAGQTVPHLHIHLLGGRTLTWPPG